MNEDYREADWQDGGGGMPPAPPPPPPSRSDRQGYGHLPHGGGAPPPYMGRVTAGIIILLVGSIIIASAGFINDPMQPDSDDYDDYDDYDDDMKDYRDDIELYQDSVRTVGALGGVIQAVGMMILALGLAAGALTDDRLGPAVRAGMLIAMGIIIGMKLSVSYLTYMF